MGCSFSPSFSQGYDASDRHDDTFDMMVHISVSCVTFAWKACSCPSSPESLDLDFGMDEEPSCRHGVSEVDERSLKCDVKFLNGATRKGENCMIEWEACSAFLL